MAIPPIGAGVPIAPPVYPPAPAAGGGAVQAADGRPGDGFGDLVTRAVDTVERDQAGADRLATKAATGDLTDVHDYMIAATQAQLSTELTVAVRNKALDAFNEIMRMPV
jgi:flagellar hook-basal body complex protein FliE